MNTLSELKEMATEQESLKCFHENLRCKSECEYRLRVGPRLALEMLKRNTKNRTVYPTDVQFLASEILAGRWAALADGAAFDNKGVLVDGQHRLFAIIEAKSEVTLTVTFGLHPDARIAVDIRGRDSMATKLAQIGFSEASARAAIASVCIRVIRPEKGRIIFEQLEAFCHENKTELDFVLERKLRLSRLGASTPLLGALVLALRGRSEEGTHFIETVLSGVRSGANDPTQKFLDIAKFRELRGSAAREYAVTAALNCVEAFIEKRSISRNSSGRVHLEYFRRKAA
jgi:hypothetical protein